MTGRSIVNDIVRILTKNNVTQDTRFEPLNILSMFNDKRAAILAVRPESVDSQNISNLGILQMTATTYGDDVSLAEFDTIKAGKIKIPTLVPIGNGIFKVFTLSRQNTYINLEPSLFGMMVRASDPMLKVYRYYIYVGNDLYIYPYQTNCQLMAYLHNPLEGYFNDNTNQTNIRVGVSYTVYDSPISYNGLIYRKGIAFVGIDGIESFVGDGHVKFTHYKRAMTLDDPYPCSPDIRELAIKELLKTEFRIEENTLTDLYLTGTDDAITFNKDQTPKGAL